MIRKSLWRGVLIAALSVTLASAAPAGKTGLAWRPDLLSSNNGGGFQKLGDEIAIAIVVVAVAVGVVVTVLVVHYKSRKRAITGCVHSEANVMSMTDEKDKRRYALSGNTVGVKPGDRVTLEGKPAHAGKTLVFEAHGLVRDFGACQP